MQVQCIDFYKATNVFLLCCPQVSGKFEILGRSVDYLFFNSFLEHSKLIQYCIVHEFKPITKCTSFVNQNTMTQPKKTYSKQVIC